MRSFLIAPTTNPKRIINPALPPERSSLTCLIECRAAELINKNMNTEPAFCFIRKNNPELREKLKEMGYRAIADPYVNEDMLIAHPVPEPLFVDTYCSSPGLIPALIRDGFIDCGTDEELFLATAEETIRRALS